jgi:hypothetical protein
MAKVYDLCSREGSAGTVGHKHPASCRHVLILSTLRAEPNQADVYQEHTLGFRADN